MSGASAYGKIGRYEADSRRTHALRLCFFQCGKLLLDDSLALAGDDHPRARFLDVVPVLEEQAPHERWWPLAGVVRKDGGFDLIASRRVQRAELHRGRYLRADTPA